MCKKLLTIAGREYEKLFENQPYFLGRWFEKEIDGAYHQCTTTDGALVFFAVEGSDFFHADFTDVTHIREPYFAYSIDGGEPVRRHISEGTVALPDAGLHAVRLIADGMTEGEGKFYEEIGFALRRVTVSAEGRMYGIKPTAPLVFYYGDSITEGIRAISMAADSDGNSATHAYPWYCSEALGVTPYYIGYGASGMIRPGWFHTMEKAIDYLSWRYMVEESPAANQKPDLIVINHGTNDQDFPMMDFLNALRATLSHLYKKYPGVPVVYVIPLQQVFATLIRRVMAEYPRGYVVESESWRVTFTDGIHPNAAGARVMGEGVAEAIKGLGILPETNSASE
jgi:lysophospholipase L1-like esterase